MDCTYNGANGIHCEYQKQAHDNCAAQIHGKNHHAVNAEERHSVPENSSMVSYGKLCNCGGVNYLLSTSYGEWVNASEEKCTSHTYGTDIIQTRSAAKTYRCSSCSKGYVEHLMETKRVCHGYDY